MGVKSWTTFSTILISMQLLFLGVDSASLKSVIPDSIKECYKNQTLLLRDNLLPMTMPVLIDLIRKVEKYQGLNMDLRTLTTVLLQRFRLDGIERNPDVMGNYLVIPYSPSGSEFYKFKFLMESLIPNQPYLFPNSSLNMVEQCTLHWMLSSSVDRLARGDEGTVCNQLSNYARWNNRIKRDEPKEHLQTDRDAETVDGSSLMNDMPAYPNTGYHQQGMQNYQQGMQNYQQGMNFRSASYSSDHSYSMCPVENGVVYTNYGAVKAGIVLAGIAAGLQSQSVSRNNLIQVVRSRQPNSQFPRSGSNYPTASDTPVNNKWAATISGELAEVAILQGPANPQSMRIGLGGGWNNSMVPRYYFLSENSKDALTESDIRGSIDGLIMANSIMEWTRLANGLRLSQLLEMYYSEVGVFDIDKKACSRKDKFAQLAPINILQQESENFAFVLQYEQPSSVNMEFAAIQELTSAAVTKLVSKISSMSDPTCSNVAGLVPTPFADLYIIIDTAWDFISIQGLLSTLIEKCDVNPYGSRVTVMSGKDGSILVNTTNYITDFHQNFTYNKYNMYQRGFDLSQSLWKLQMMIEIEINLQKQTLSGGSNQYNSYYDNNRDSYSNSYGRQSSYGSSTNSPVNLPKIVIFIPSNTAGSSDGESNLARSRLYYFKTNLPDIKLLFFVSGSRDRYSQYADNPIKDIFTVTTSSSINDMAASISPIVARITEIQRPIMNPTCGSSWVGRWYGSMQSNVYLQPNTIHYYKIHPNYFYKTTDGKVRIQSQGSTSLTICQSRSNSLPNANSTNRGEVNCKEINSDTFELRISENSCGDSYAYQCAPYYLSVSLSSKSQTGGSLNNILCIDEMCRYPNTVKYTLTHEGLTCYSGAMKIISNPLLSLSLIFILFKQYF